MRSFLDLMAVILISIMAVVMPVMVILYSNQFHINKNTNTATNGIWFKSTVNLKKYTKLGEATTLFCDNSAVIYTRFINHESFTVCK